MEESNLRIEDRVGALESQMVILSQRMTEISLTIDREMGNRSLQIIAARTDSSAAANKQALGNQPKSQSNGRLLGDDLFLHTATVCFILAIALVLRIVAENQILPTFIGVMLGVVYCMGLALWSLLPASERYGTSRTVGISSLFVLSLVLFESYRFMHQLDEKASFPILALATIVSVAMGWKYGMPPVGWTALIAAPILFIAMMLPVLSYGWLCALILLSSAIAFAGQGRWGLRPAQMGLSLTILFVFFYWNRDLNYLYYMGDQVYSANEGFIIGTIGFAFVLFIPSLISAFAGRRLSWFEKAIPTITVLAAFLFLQNEMRRIGVLDLRLEKASLAASGFILAAGVWFGVRNRPYGYGLRTFLCAGVVLFLLASPAVFPSRESLIVAWCCWAFVLFWLSIYFQCPDLRFLSYLLQSIVLLAAVIQGALFFHPANHSWAASLSLFMAISLSIHYGLGRNVKRFLAVEKDAALQGSDRFAVVLLFGSMLSLYLFERNLLMKFIGPSPLTSCLLSIGLTLIASIAVLAGIGAGNREIESAGIFGFLAAGFKVFVLDLFFGTKEYSVFSVFLFGLLASICSFFLRRIKRSQTE